MSLYHISPNSQTPLKFLLSVFLSALAGCATVSTMGKAHQEQISQAFEGKQFYLNESLYGGRFYDDHRFKMLHPRNFNSVSLLQTPDGHVITPPHEREVVAVGTQVTISKVEWPTGETIFKRPLYTPRKMTWLKLKVALERGETTLNRDKTYIMIVPDAIKTEAQFDTWARRFFSTEDTNIWVRTLDKEIQAGVLSKEPKVDMGYRELTAALGEPDKLIRKFANKEKTITREVATYGGTLVILEDGKVKEIHASKNRFK